MITLTDSNARPWLVATTYGVLASLIVAATSFYEGSFWIEKTVTIGDMARTWHPYKQNFSTILDFALLNPIAIFFIFRARAKYAAAFEHFNKGGALNLFNKLGLTFLSCVVGVAAMWFYFDDFVGGTFFTETFIPGPAGTAVISKTGWAVFAATAIAISLLFYAFAEFVNYLLFLFKLSADNFELRLPPSISSDYKVAIAPCIDVTYLLTTLFVVIGLFILRDFFQFWIESSDRIWWLGAHIICCIIAFLPFLHLHRLMKEQRDHVIDHGNQAFENDLGVQREEHLKRTTFDASKLLGSIDHIQKLQVFYASIPVWPTGSGRLLLPNISFLISVLTVAHKTFSLLTQPPQ
jgi:hypothetical protein